VIKFKQCNLHTCVSDFYEFTIYIIYIMSCLKPLYSRLVNSVKQVNAKEWSEWVKSLQGIYYGYSKRYTRRQNNNLDDVTIWQNCTIVVHSIDIINCKATLGGIGTSHWRGQSFFFTLQIEVIEYNLYIDKMTKVRGSFYSIYYNAVKSDDSLLLMSKAARGKLIKQSNLRG
jgi:hypothetical protein